MMQKYHKNGRKVLRQKEEERYTSKDGRKRKRKCTELLNRVNALIIPAYVYFASEALTGLLILISEYGGKTIICNKVIICRWRRWRET